MRRILIISGLLACGQAFCALPPPAPSLPIPLPKSMMTELGDHTPFHAYSKVTGDPVADFSKERLQTAHPHSVALHKERSSDDYEALLHALPAPKLMPHSPERLSLRDAVALALRGNPKIKVSELQRILDKFGLTLIKQQYRVLWNPFTLSATLQNKANPQWAEGLGASITAPSGTNFAVTQTNNLLGGPGNTTLSVTQPLLKGFGFAVNRVNYQNGIDSERIAQLNFKDSVMNVVVSVVKAYRNLVSAYNSLSASQNSLENQKKSVAQSRLKVKAGKMAPSDLMQQESTLESTHLSVVQQENQLRDAYQAFLSSLGLSPSANIIIDPDIDLKGIKVPTFSECVSTALRNNIAYQSALIRMSITKRALITAKDARKWTLNVSSSVTLGAQRSAVGTPIGSTGTNPTLGVNLSIPIDNIAAKQGVESAKIAIENAKLNLEQQREDLIRTVVNQWKAIQNQQRQVAIAKLSVKLQEKTLANAKLKLHYGKSSVFETNTLETNLLSSQVGLIGEKINYLNYVTDLYQTMGVTLDKWKIKLQY